jgi:beta-phosphoglucomutase-like phosphatase (HAD superfamily)
MEKILLSDADGVLVQWNKAFYSFMDANGYTVVPEHKDNYHVHERYGIELKEQWKLVREFNEGPIIENLEPFADSVQYINQLVEDGFKIVIVTSLSNAPQAIEYRTKNLHKIFGSVFEEIKCLPIGSIKYKELLRWKDKGYFWIEDHEHQAIAGYQAGLRAVLIDHPYNQHFFTEDFARVSNHRPWEEIYNLVRTVYNY